MSYFNTKSKDTWKFEEALKSVMEEFSYKTNQQGLTTLYNIISDRKEDICKEWVSNWKNYYQKAKSKDNDKTRTPQAQYTMSNTFNFKKNKNVTVNQTNTNSEPLASCSNSKRSSHEESNVEKPPTAVKKQKTTYLYLEGRDTHDEPVLEDIKWEINGQDISKQLLSYRSKCIEEAKSKEKLKSDIDVLALNSIYHISKNNTKYNIPHNLYQAMLQELHDKYNIEYDVDLDKLEVFQIGQLRPVYKAAREDVKEAKKLATNSLFDTDDIDEEAMCQSAINFLEQHPHIKDHHSEDMFTKKFITPIICPFLNESKHIRQTGNAEEAGGSKNRKKINARMSDGGLKVVYKELEQQILHIEVKGPSVITEDNLYHPDFVKLANLLKDEVDLLLDRNCPSETPVYAILVGGHKASVYSMDLVYTKIYRLHDIGQFNIPHGSHDMKRLDDAYDVLIKLKELLKKSEKDVLRFFRLITRPGSPPRSRRQMQVLSFRSPTKITEKYQERHPD